MTRISTRALTVVTVVCLTVAVLTCVVLYLLSLDQPMSFITVNPG